MIGYLRVSCMLYEINFLLVVVPCLYKQEIFSEGRRRKITAAKIYNTLKSLLKSYLVSNQHTHYFIYLQLLMESQCLSEPISSGKDSRLMYIILYPFYFYLYNTNHRIINYNLCQVLHLPLKESKNGTAMVNLSNAYAVSHHLGINTAWDRRVRDFANIEQLHIYPLGWMYYCFCFLGFFDFVPFMFFFVFLFQLVFGLAFLLIGQVFSCFYFFFPSVFPFLSLMKQQPLVLCFLLSMVVTSLSPIFK